MIAELQVLPRPAGTDAVPYANVHAAIAVLADPQGATFGIMTMAER